MTKNRFYSSIFATCVFFSILSFSIALPIYLRSFYYLHITPLNLEAQGFTYSQIVNSYNSALNYLTLPNKNFSVGVMKFSENGASHFADCKALITLNMTVLIISFILIVIFLLLKKLGKLSSLKWGKHSAAFRGAVCALGVPILIGVVASLNFNKAFDVFHKIFFMGKSNWVFDKTQDEIIKVLPEIFFRNCAILIAASIFVISLVIIICELKSKKH